MALLLTSPPFLLSKNTNPNPTLRSFPLKPHSLSFSVIPKTTTAAAANRRFSTTVCFSSSTFSGDSPDDKPEDVPAGVVDEWGEKSEPETEPSTKLSDSDPPKDEDEWSGVSAGDDYVTSGNGSAPAAAAADEEDSGGDDKMMELKRSLVDTVYGTNLGYGATSEVRAEVAELVCQLEAANPTPAPTEAVGVLDGKWVLLYTAFSELLPLLAAGTTPLLKVERICQVINTRSLEIENSITFSSPFATFSSSAIASFEVRTPSRIQVEFKEGIVQPPEVKSSIDLPGYLDIFGQRIDLSPVQQALNPLQEVVANVARTISGQSPLKVPIPGERTKSWLLTTYLDKDLRVSRGDGGLFVLAKEGSPLLYQ
ncbi:unnamed protein product [Camellia sinensis]